MSSKPSGGGLRLRPALRIGGMAVEVAGVIDAVSAALGTESFGVCWDGLSSQLRCEQIDYEL